MPGGKGSVDNAPNMQIAMNIRGFKTGKAQIFFLLLHFYACMILYAFMFLSEVYPSVIITN